MNRNGTILLVEIPTICFAKVVIPVAYMSPSGLIVTPAPTIMSSLNVAMPATSKIPVLTFYVSPVPVKLEPSPINVVAVTTPVKNASPSGLRVIPDPTRELALNVEIPATSKIPVLTLSVEAIPVSAEPSPA